MITGAILTITLPDGRTWQAPLNAEVVALLLAESEQQHILPHGSGPVRPSTLLPSPAEIAAGQLEGMLHRSALV